MKDLNEKLENIGLTRNEARVYLFLLRYKEAKTGIICSKLNIANSHIYQTLEKLLEKGIISYKIINNIKVFRPVDPESLYSLFKEKEIQLEKEKKELKSFIEGLKKVEIKEPRENDFKYFEGVGGIRSMFTEFINSWERNSTCFVASAPLAYEKWNAFLLHFFHPPRKKKNILLKLIIPKNVSKAAETERKKFQPIEIRWSGILLDTEFGVCGEYTYFLSKGEKPYGLLIKDKNLANTQIESFKALWSQSRKNK